MKLKSVMTILLVSRRKSSAFMTRGMARSNGHVVAPWGHRVCGRTGPGILKDTLLTLFNEDLSIEPPVDIEEIEVTHHLPRGKMMAVQYPRPCQAANNNASVASDENAPMWMKTGHKSHCHSLCRRTKSKRQRR